MTALTVGLELTSEQVDVIAQRVAQLLERQAPAGPEPWLTVAQASQHLACGRSRVYSLVSARRIPFCKDGSRVLFRASELDEWLAAGGGRRP